MILERKYFVIFELESWGYVAAKRLIIIKIILACKMLQNLLYFLQVVEIRTVDKYLAWLKKSSSSF